MACLVAFAAAACATAPRSPLPDLERVPVSFEMSGRIAIRTTERSDIAKLRWTRRGRSDLWIIASPLGNEVARLESGPSGTTLARAGQPTVNASSFQELTENVLGVGLDPDRLAAWLHGNTPNGGAGDWKVTLDETQKAGAVSIARRITATRGDVVVRLVVDEYHPLAD